MVQMLPLSAILAYGHLPHKQLVENNRIDSQKSDTAAQNYDKISLGTNMLNGRGGRSGPFKEMAGRTRRIWEDRTSP